MLDNILRNFINLSLVQYGFNAFLNLVFHAAHFHYNEHQRMTDNEWVSREVKMNLFPLKQLGNFGAYCVVLNASFWRVNKEEMKKPYN